MEIGILESTMSNQFKGVEGRSFNASKIQMAHGLMMLKNLKVCLNLTIRSYIRSYIRS